MSAVSKAGKTEALVPIAVPVPRFRGRYTAKASSVAVMRGEAAIHASIRAGRSVDHGIRRCLGDRQTDVGELFISHATLTSDCRCRAMP